MIAKSKDPGTPKDRFEQAGDAAEEQMAFYLRRAFSDAPDVLVINDLRLVEADDCAQIDHLVLHAFGMFIVESKSISGEVEVNEHGEWIRNWGRQRAGMPSPIQQAKRQADFLRALLGKHKETLRDKRAMGYIQPGFDSCSINLCVAISDKGIIKRNGTILPEVMKADQVCDRIKQVVKRHRKASGLISLPDGDYGMWKLSPEEMHRVRDFLLARHTPRQSAPTPPVMAKAQPAPKPAVPATAASAPVTAKPSCKHCGSGELVGSYGKFGYYFKCSTCEKNTPIDYACTACSKKGRIRKQGPKFYRVCEGCGHDELIWESRAST